ncbi:MAG: hypothetical protein ABJO09_02620 [Hyphomicrobiales bacterium]
MAVASVAAPIGRLLTSVAKFACVNFWHFMWAMLYALGALLGDDILTSFTNSGFDTPEPM